jgi:CheY-like chemotaxis protein
VSLAVLVVEDDEDIRGFVTIVLQDAGYAVTEAGNGAEALQQIEQAAPDVILLDMKMPVMDGWEFAHRYKAISAAPAPTIVMTAARDARIRGSEVNAVEVLSKPFDVDDLLAAVARVVARRH